jgi:hypothetical protein
METGSVKYNSEFINDQMIAANMFQKRFSFDKNGRTPVFDNLVNERCEYFFTYLDFVGLANASNLVVLSSNHHYFYDADELKDVKTVVNLKPLNHIKDIRNLLHNIFHLLPQKSNFVGCFINNKKQSVFYDKNNNLQTLLSGGTDTYENGIESRIPLINRMYSFMDFRTNRYMSSRTVSLLLEESGLKVLNMTEINGLTYFYAQKAQRSA